MTEYTEDEKIFAEKVNQLYINAPIGLIATLVNAFILALVLRSASPSYAIIYWLTGIIVIFLFRSVLIYRYRVSPSNPENAVGWNYWFNISMAVTGIIWGTSAIFLFPIESIAHQVFLTFVLGGMVAGMAGTFAANLVTFISFTLPAFIPIIIRFFLIWDDIHVAMGVMYTLFYVLMFFTARRVNKTNHQSLKLKYENEDLVKHLQQAKDRAENYNAELKQEIEERLRIESELKSHKDHLEELVHDRTNELKNANIELKKEITERTEAQKALRESEEKYRLLVDNANDGIVIVQDEKIKFANQATCTFSGYTQSELIGLSFKDFVHQEDMNKIIERYTKRISGGEVPQMYSMRIYAKGDKTLWVQNNAVLIEWDGQPAILNFLRDITLIRELENQLHHRNKMEAIGTLAGGIAHDFNNILNIIYGYIELSLLDLAEKDPVRKHIAHIQKAARRAKDIVGQILSFSRKSDSQKIPVDVRAIVEEALTLLRASLPASIKINTDISPIPSSVMADPTQIHQLLMNLCTNAAHSMEDEGGEMGIHIKKIELSADDAEQYPDIMPGDCVQLSVSDTGHGMDPLVQERIFEPYFTTKDIGNGTGMGLAQCYGIVKSYNGAIRVVSEVGKGSTFEVLLPCSSQSVTESPETTYTPPSDGKGRILLVDDEEDVAQVAGTLLKRLGYETVTELDPDKAFKRFEAQPEAFDLVITDMSMPRMNGVRLAEKLRAVRPDILIVLSSGYSEVSGVTDLKKSGQIEFLQKPYNMERLSGAVRNIMGQQTGENR